MAYTMLGQQLGRLVFLGAVLLTMGSTTAPPEGCLPGSTGKNSDSILESGSAINGPRVVYRGPDTPTPSTDSISIPLNFWLESTKHADLTPYAAQVTDERVHDFLATGLTAVGTVYGFDGSACRYAITRPDPHDASGIPRGGLRQESFYYRVDVAVDCNDTSELSLAGATPCMKTLLKIDHEAAANYRYKGQFRAEVSALIYATKPDRVLFVVGTYMNLRRRPYFGPKDLFEQSREIDQEQVDQLRNDIRLLLVKVYARSLSSMGLSTEAADPDQS